MAWSDSTISRFAQEAETSIIVDNDLLVDRISLALSASINQYQIPDCVTSIRRVTYLGYPLEPYSGQEFIWSGSYPKTITSSKPGFYIYSNFGQKVIKLFPAPPIDLPASTDDLWDVTAITTSFIIEFNRQPDFVTEDLRLPTELRRQYVKTYVLKNCFKQEGKGQDLKASAYFAQKAQMESRDIIQYKNNLSSSIINSRQPQQINPLYIKPGRPQLPPQFGVTVR